LKTLQSPEVVGAFCIEVVRLQVDVLVSQGQSVADAIRQIGVTEVVYVMSSLTASEGWAVSRNVRRDIRNQLLCLFFLF
jgi:hypothetical protein